MGLDLGFSDAFVSSRLFASVFGFCHGNDTRNDTRTERRAEFLPSKAGVGKPRYHSCKHCAVMSVWLTEEKPVLWGDRRWNGLRPDAVTSLGETYSPHHIDRQRTVHPS